MFCIVKTVNLLQNTNQVWKGIRRGVMDQSEIYNSNLKCFFVNFDVIFGKLI